LREIEGRLRVADRLAACRVDPRAPDQVTHSFADIVRFRLLMIAAGFEDGIDATNFGPTPELPSRAQTRTKIPVGAKNRAEN
jgi:class 3 adenylate cyclase